MKPLIGPMHRNDKYVNKNFHDEKEWRFIPKFNQTETDLSLLIPEEQLIPQTINLYSDGISQNNALWLHLDY